MTNISDIPHVLLIEIFQYLPPFQLPPLVCKAFHQACLSDTLWTRFLKDRYPDEHPTSSPRQQFVDLFTRVCLERKTMNLGRNLHLLGYPCAAYCSLSPSGCYWRFQLTYDDESYHFSNGSQTELFEIAGADKLSEEEIVKQFLDIHKWKKRSPSEIEKLHMRWYEQVLESIGKNDLIYECADWYETPKSAPVVCRTELSHQDKEIPFWNDVQEMYQSSGKIHPFLELNSLKELKMPNNNKDKCIIS